MIELKEDEYYLDTDGNIIKNDFATQLLSAFQSKDKTVSHIPKELHYRICELIKDYHTSDRVKVFINSNYENRKVNKWKL